jgi:hypothetical protein
MISTNPLFGNADYATSRWSIISNFEALKPLVYQDGAKGASGGYATIEAGVRSCKATPEDRKTGGYARPEVLSSSTGSSLEQHRVKSCKTTHDACASVRDQINVVNHTERLERITQV